MEQFGNPSDFEKIQDNNDGKPNQPWTRAARILDAQKEVDKQIDNGDSVLTQEK